MAAPIGDASAAGPGSRARGAGPAPSPSELDHEQLAAIHHVGSSARVLGAPGTGKTTVVVEHVLHACRARGLTPAECLVLAPSRVAATALRERITTALGGTCVEPLARTPESLAFAVVRAHSALESESAPHLITGAEQDVILAELLGGHREGAGRGPQWPDELRLATGTRGFRQQLRELLMRAAEHGLDADGLGALAVAHERPAWSAAAEVLREYEEVVALSRPGAYDPAGLVATAARMLTWHDEVRRRICDGLRLLVVDDAQELSVAGARLVAAIHAAGVPVLLAGDPDVGTQAFRGGDPDFLARGWAGDAGRGSRDEQGSGATTYVLRHSYRAGQQLLDVATRVRSQVGASTSLAHRRALPAPGVDDGRCETAVVESQAREARHIASALRRAHLIDGLPWDEMAIIVRGGDRSATLRRALLAEGVPVRVPGAKVPLRDEPAVRPLLRLLSACLLAESPLACDDVVDLMTSRVVGADSLAVRRLRRELRLAELAAGGSRSSDVLLEAAVAWPGEPGPSCDHGVVADRPGVSAAEPGDAPSDAPADECVDESVDASMGSRAEAPARERPARHAEALARLQRALRAGRDAVLAGGGAEDILWALWDSLGVSTPWRAQSMRSGAAAARAERDLDAVCALFDAARRYGERLPGSHPRAFLEHIGSQEVAADSLVAGATRAGEVTLTTPAGAVGREWHTVVVAGVQEGVWPDLRPRGTVLGVGEVVDAIRGLPAMDSAGRLRVTRQDEARLLLMAVSRAARRLIVTAVRDEQTQPSAYLDVIDPPDTASALEQVRAYTPAARPLTLAAIVAQLRRALSVEEDPVVRAQVSTEVERLRAAGVAAADPQRWWTDRDPSDNRPLRRDEQQVTVSPSKVEAFTQCGLRWLLTSCGGRSGHDEGSAAIGSLVHEIAAEVDNGDEEAMLGALRARWPRLGLGQGWLARRKFAEATRMLSRLARYDAESRAQGWQVVAKEVEATVEVGRATVRGRVDRLERDADGRLRVVDLKTGASKPTKAELRRQPQLGAYQVAISRGAFEPVGDRPAGAALLQLGKAAGASVTLQTQPGLAVDDDPAWAESLVREVADGMAASTFEARASDLCRHCPAFDSCPLQTAGWQL